MRIFWNKNAKITSALGDLPLNPHLPPAAESFAPRPPRYYSYLLLQSVFYYPQKEQNNYSKCSAFASSTAFAHIYHFKLCSFVDGEHKNVSCPRT